MSTEKVDIVVRESGGIQATAANPIGQMLQQITAAGVTSDNAAALEKMTDLYLRVEAANARKEFSVAKAGLQAELPNVRATKAVPNNDGTVRYAYAPYESIMRQVAPLLSKHGFSISFGQKVEEKRITAVCTLSHIGGHSETNEFAVRVGQGPPKASEAQADGAASTYAKRFALCNCLNITVDLPDNDARREGDRITAGQAEDLKRRVSATNANEAAFLRFAGASTYEEIREGKYGTLIAMLNSKKPTTAAATPAKSGLHEYTDDGSGGQSDHGESDVPPVTPAEARVASDGDGSPAGGSGVKTVTEAEIAHYPSWYVVMQDQAMAYEWAPGDFDKAIGALKVALPIAVESGKGAAARRKVLEAMRAGKLGTDGKIQQ